jgi:hypothetical protein
MPPPTARVASAMRSRRTPRSTSNGGAETALAFAIFVPVVAVYSAVAHGIYRAASGLI